MILLLFICNVLLFIPEPIHRHLIEEFNEEENTRFIINFISVIIFITKKSPQQLNFKKATF